MRRGTGVFLKRVCDEPRRHSFYQRRRSAEAGAGDGREESRSCPRSHRAGPRPGTEDHRHGHGDRLEGRPPKQWNFSWLRDACPCATCHEERGATGRKPGEPKPQPATLLQMYKAPARPESVAPVGRYAISFRWNDGHQSGIYSWDYLRRHCQCEACRIRPL